MELWRDQLLDFMAEFTGGTAATLVGNSIGGLASLMAAAAAPQGSVRGLVLLNTAGALNNKVPSYLRIRIPSYVVPIRMKCPVG